MIRAIAWHELAQEDLLRMPWRAAVLVDEAVQRFAERGEGALRGVTVEGRRELRLYIAPYFVWLSVTPERVIVWRVLRYA
jgi:hypothetical protein